MVPALTMGGVLLWRRAAWGFVLATVAGVQGSLYLIVLAVNSVIMIRGGLVEPPGELPIWGSLGLITAAVTAVLLTNAGATRSVTAQTRGKIRSPAR